ncbi:MAG: hypothetical protein QW655_01685 [Nitrososphaerota archaeon]
MDESLELKLLRLKKLKQMMSQRPVESKEKSGELDFSKALEIVQKHLVDRGDEVLEVALRDYPEITKKIVVAIAKKILEGSLSGEIPGGALLKLFESLGLRVRLETSIKFYKDGEYRLLSDILKKDEL